jgi:hypothetical protein
MLDTGCWMLEATLIKSPNQFTVVSGISLVNEFTFSNPESFRDQIAEFSNHQFTKSPKVIALRFVSECNEK